MADETTPVSLSNLAPDQIERGAWLLFNKANPDTPEAAGDLDRDQWFNLTRDYWMRAARELAALWWPPMTVECPCGWSASGPSREVSWNAQTHRCEKIRSVVALPQEGSF